uniref:GOLD domain-containing protein n=1 Tax=Hemiselmis tepida TaxID=464990 RepID=A0A7S0W9Z1_9CRYP|mmetsp:Transcript_993/g.2487  ORF Transcript_993/g.2487 Transcript_993/m.2487 type:complete len:215 (+) Transcript_993:190-834(+)
MARTPSVLYFALLAVLLCEADALFTKVKQNHPKCFIEELHKDEVVIVHYKSPDQSPLPHEAEQQKFHVGVKLEVTQGATKVFEGRTDVEGRFAFTALQGEHHLCFSVEGQSLGQDFRIHLEVKVGLNDVDYEKVAKKEHLSSLELQVRKIRDDVHRVTSEQSYFRNREERSKRTADSTYFRAMWFSLCQILAMLGVSGIYLLYLRSYFKAKKLV